jgi:predicted O-methyltransferase YrrM
MIGADTIAARLFDRRFIEAAIELSALLCETPDATFDLISVDGDYRTKGVIQDLRDVLPQLNAKAAIIFDDACHPSHPDLDEVWLEFLVSNPKYSSLTYRDAGSGVVFAIRKN